MISEHKYAAEILPARGRTRALDMNGTTVDEYDLDDVFVTTWNDGEFYSMVSTVAFFIVTSTTSGDTVDVAIVMGDDSDVGETQDQAPGYVPANTIVRALVEKSHRYLYLKSASAGTLRIWRSSSKDR